MRAIDYCSAKEVEYFFADYKLVPAILEEYKEFHDQATVPIILANNLETGYTKKIGGYSELLEYL